MPAVRSYVILTSKPGIFRTELVADLRPIATYEYFLCGQKKAEFCIVELTKDVRLRVIDEAPPPVVSEIPSKFLTKFQTVDAARAELRHLTAFGHMDAQLRLRE